MRSIPSCSISSEIITSWFSQALIFSCFMHGDCWLHKFSRKWRKAGYALNLQNSRELKSSSQSDGVYVYVDYYRSSPFYKRGSGGCSPCVCSCITHISSLYHSSPIYYTSCLHYYNCTIDTILCMHCFGFCKELMPKSVNMSFRKEKGPKELPSKALSLRQLRWISICTWWTVPPVLDREKRA